MTSAAEAGTVRISDRTVARFGYGTMRLTGPGIWGPPADREEAIRVLRRAVELGVTVFDTAWYYGDSVASELLAAALRPYPSDLLLVTKLGGARRQDGSWYSDLSDAALRAGNERDRQVLGLECVPVTHLRWPDGSRANPVPFDEALGTMLALQVEGRIQHIGLSNVSRDQLDAALARTPIVTVSNVYSVGNRSGDNVLDRCEELGIPFLPFFPLDAGKHGAQAVVASVARRLGVTAAQVNLAWLLARSPTMVPIPGTSSVAHLEENLASVAVHLDGAAMRDLDAVTGPTQT